MWDTGLCTVEIRVLAIMGKVLLAFLVIISWSFQYSLVAHSLYSYSFLFSLISHLEFPSVSCTV